MNSADFNFKKLCTTIMEDGCTTEDGNVRPVYLDGTPAHTKYTTQVFETYDLSKGEFPILTLRPLAWKSAIKEILWIYQDQSNDLDLLKDKYNITWWDEWDIGDRTIGQRYGATVKRYDLINNLIDDLISDPYSRRHIMNLYQYSDLDETKGLHPCAMETQWSVRNINGDKYLDLILIQRSSDVAVANAINKIQYVALQMMIARHCGFKLGKFSHYVNNAHIYDRHFKQVEELLNREGQHKGWELELVLNPDKSDFYEFTIDDFSIPNYEPVKPNLKFELGI